MESDYERRIDEAQAYLTKTKKEVQELNEQLEEQNKQRKRSSPKPEETVANNTVCSSLKKVLDVEVDF